MYAMLVYLQISISSFGFEPSSLKVAVGTTLMFSLEGDKTMNMEEHVIQVLKKREKETKATHRICRFVVVPD